MTVSEKLRKTLKKGSAFLEQNFKDAIAVSPKSKIGTVAKVYDVSEAAVLKFLYWLFLDNKLLQKMETFFSGLSDDLGEQEKKFKQFIKNNPGKTTYALYYLMLGGLLVGGKGAIDANSLHRSSKAGTKKEKLIFIDNLETYHENRNSLFNGKSALVYGSPNTYYADTAKISNDTIGTYADKTVYVYDLKKYYAGIIEVVKAMNSALVMIPEGICYNALYTTVDKKWNLGFCLTECPVDRNNPYGKWRPVKKGDKCTTEEAVLWSGIFYELKVFPSLTSALKVPVSPHMYLVLADFAYNNRSPHNYGNQMIYALNNGASEEDVLKMFSHYRGGKAGPIVRRGLLKREWLRAGIAGKFVDPLRMLECNVGGLNNATAESYYEDDITDNSKAYYKYDFSSERVEAFYNQVVLGTPTVREVLEKSKTGRKYINIITSVAATQVFASKQYAIVDTAQVDKKQDKKAQPKKTEKDNAREKTNTMSSDGLKAYKKGDYATAEKKFREILIVDKYNFNAHNDLIITLYRAGKYSDATIAAQTGIDLAHSYENNDNEIDNDVYAAFYYNAGLARKELGELSVARANFVTASKRNPENQVYKNAIKDIDNKLKSFKGKKKDKKTALLDAKSKIEKKDAQNHTFFVSSKELFG